MAKLTPTERDAELVCVLQEFNRGKVDWNGLTKPDVLAAIAAIDDWFDANEVSLNAAIPQPTRGALTIADKSRLVTHVQKARYEAVP